MILGVEKVIEHKMRVLISSKKFVRKTSHFKKNSGRYIHCEVPVIRATF
jgi:hypothetical protein